MDTSKLCRSCMKEVASWERENFNIRAVEMFCFCTNLKITEDDKLPKQFCYDCIIKIESSFTYITKAQKVEALFKNIILGNNTNIKVESEIKTRNIDLKLILPDYKVSAAVDNKFVKYDSTDFSVDTGQVADDTEENTIEASLEGERQTNKEPESATEINAVETKKHVCPKCRKEFTSKLWFNKHMEKEHKEPKFVHCQKKEKTIEATVKEEAKQTNKDTESATEINAAETKKHVCPMCRKEFTSKLWFKKHMDKEHEGPKFVCEHCQKIFSKQWELKQHSACHTDERKHSCSECGKCFKRRNQLRKHARAHSDLRPFECDKCGMKFKFKSVLKSHLRVHEGDKPFLCYFCGRSFAQAGNLLVHIRQHTGHKPHACAQCSFRTAAASSLQRHQRRHRRDTRYVCALCDKGFYDTSSLDRHSRIHSGELPFQCPGCSRAFADSWKRKTHLMRAHKLTLTDIPPMTRDGRTIH